MIEDMDSVIRYYPSASSSAHYSAIQLEKGILQVKTPEGPVKKRFATCEEWCETLPGKPKVEDLSMIVPIIKPEWNVPELSTTFGKWLSHIYNCIRQTNPEFIKRDDMRTAYNEMVKSITSQNKICGMAITYIGLHELLDRDYLNLEKSITVHISVEYYYTPGLLKIVNDTPMSIALKIIHAAYTPLYKLMQPEVIPFITKRIEMTKLDGRIKTLKEIVARVTNELDELTKQVESKKQFLDHYTALLKKTSTQRDEM